MFHFRRHYLKRIDFINLVDSDKIWKKKLTKPEINDLLDFLEENLAHYDFSHDNDFFMNGRRTFCKGTIERLISKDNKNINDVLDSLFTFWEFVGDEYTGTLYSISDKLDIPVKRLENMDRAYRKKGIICSQEKDIIIDLIKIIRSGLKDMDEE